MRRGGVFRGEASRRVDWLATADVKSETPMGAEMLVGAGEGAREGGCRGAGRERDVQRRRRDVLRGEASPAADARSSTGGGGGYLAVGDQTHETTRKGCRRGRGWMWSRKKNWIRGQKF